MLFRSLILISAVALVGCSGVRQVGTNGNGDYSYEQVNKDVRGKVARITFNGGSELSVVGLRVEADSISWVDHRNNRLRSAATDDVRRISMVKAGPGALVGLVVGSLVGAGVGAYRGWIMGDDPPDDLIGITREEKVRLFAKAHAVYFSLGSIPLGAIIGARRTYRFPVAAPPPPVVSTDP
jgi:hypothetical protein